MNTSGPHALAGSKCDFTITRCELMQMQDAQFVHTLIYLRKVIACQSSHALDVTDVVPTELQLMRGLPVSPSDTCRCIEIA